MRLFNSAVFGVTLALLGWVASAQQLPASGREATTLTIAYSYDQLGQLTGVDYGNGSRIAYRYDDAGNLVLTEILVGDTRSLSINYTSGCQGSLFTIRGSGFPPNSQILLLFNNVALSPLVLSDGTGNFVSVVDTGTASNGLYVVTAMVVPASGSARSGEAAAAVGMVSFVISSIAPLRTREGGTSGAPTLSVPANIAMPVNNIFLFLPVVIR